MKLPLSIISALLIVAGLYVNNAGINNINELLASLGFDIPTENKPELAPESNYEWQDKSYWAMEKPLWIHYSPWELSVDDGEPDVFYSKRDVYLKRGTHVVSICQMKGEKEVDSHGFPVGGYAPKEVELLGNCSFFDVDDENNLITAIYKWDGKP